MSPLHNRIHQAMVDAMRARDKVRLGALRLILAEVKNQQLNDRADPDDERVLAILQRMIKQRRDSMEQYRKAGRDDLHAVEQAESDIIAEFLPAQLDDAELGRMIDKALADTGADSMRQMGAVMARLRPLLAGRADMSRVSALVRDRLTG